MAQEEANTIQAENSYQSASIERGNKNIDYTINGELSYTDIISITRGLNVIGEFFDVNAVTLVNGSRICAVALGKSLEEAFKKAIDSSPIDYMASIVVVSSEVNSDVAKLLEGTNKIVAPNYTQNAKEILETHGITYVTINTPLKDYKKFIPDSIKTTPLGILKQTPNQSELDKNTFKIVTKAKPTVEQIEDAVFAWKIAKHATSQAIIIAKDLQTVAISQGLGAPSVEYAMDYACDQSKDAILASDLPINVHNVNVAAQGRINTIIVPSAIKDVIDMADKYNIVLITTGITNVLYN